MIVCEGEKTEPLYFDEFKRDWNLPSVDVVGKHVSSSPKQLVEECVRRSTIAEDRYDAIFCVFDGDNKGRVGFALKEVEKFRRDGREISVIISVPCFEFWFLLHFAFTTASFANCDAVIARLRKWLNGYRKAQKNVYGMLKQQMAAAMVNSRRVRKHHQDHGSDAPVTNVDDLVEYLCAAA